MRDCLGLSNVGQKNRARLLPTVKLQVAPLNGTCASTGRMEERDAEALQTNKKISTYSKEKYMLRHTATELKAKN